MARMQDDVLCNEGHIQQISHKTASFLVEYERFNVFLALWAAVPALTQLIFD